MRAEDVLGHLNCCAKPRPEDSALVISVLRRWTPWAASRGSYPGTTRLLSLQSQHSSPGQLVREQNRGAVLPSFPCCSCCCYDYDYDYYIVFPFNSIAVRNNGQWDTDVWNLLWPTVWSRPQSVSMCASKKCVCSDMVQGFWCDPWIKPINGLVFSAFTEVLVCLIYWLLGDTCWNLTVLVVGLATLQPYYLKIGLLDVYQFRVVLPPY